MPHQTKHPRAWIRNSSDGNGTKPATRLRRAAGPTEAGSGQEWLQAESGSKRPWAFTREMM